MAWKSTFCMIDCADVAFAKMQLAEEHAGSWTQILIHPAKCAGDVK